MAETFPYELRLPLAPYQFEWAGEAAIDCRRSQTEAFSEERYTHADGTVVVIRNYSADGSFHQRSEAALTTYDRDERYAGERRHLETEHADRAGELGVKARA